MTAHVENPVPNSIVGHLLQLGEGHQVAIYTRRGAFWVAEFTDGESELLNAGTFFRFHARTLRYSSGCHAVALEPHVLEKIERLHQRREARDARIRDASLAVMASVMRCCRSLTLLSRSRTAKIAERGT